MHCEKFILASIFWLVVVKTHVQNNPHLACVYFIDHEALVTAHCTAACVSHTVTQICPPTPQHKHTHVYGALDLGSSCKVCMNFA